MSGGPSEQPAPTAQPTAPSTAAATPAAARLAFDLGPDVVLATMGANAALDYARWLLGRMGVRLMKLGPGDFDVDVPVMMAGEPGSGAPARPPGRSPLVVRLWDFHAARRGSGVQACAVSGVSWVIGLPGRAPLYLCSHIPEKWCGTLGTSFALSHFVERLTLPAHRPAPRVFDVSSAEVLRGFADQNFGNHRQIPTSWRRNGRVSPEHGGIFPQGYFRCRDGYVAVIGRSRQDWALILAALGDPPWATDEMRNPFKLALDSAEVERLFEAELGKHTRQELLDLALKCGATFAPVFARDEIPAQALVRDTFFDDEGMPTLPFEIFADR